MLKKLTGKLSRKLIIIVVLVLVLVGGGVLTMVMGPPITISIGAGPVEAGDTTGQTAETSEGGESSATPVAAPASRGVRPEELKGILYNTNERVVNLADLGGYRYLRISVVLEFAPPDADFYTLSGEERVAAEEAFLEGVRVRSAQIEDILTMTLTSKTFADVFTVEGKSLLKDEIKNQVNALLIGYWVNHVYFTDFVVQ